MKEPVIEIARATENDIEGVAVLFDLYRQFYGQSPDLSRAEDFIRDRLTNSESVVFLAIERGEENPVGFTQLYPTFCSVAADRIFVLYDLFVCESARQKGVGRRLMQAAQEFARREGAARINLETHHMNSNAQRLYEDLGYVRDKEFLSYSLALK